MKKLLLHFFFSISSTIIFAQAIITGKVVDDKGATLPGATISIIKSGIAITGGQTDDNGLFRITGIEPYHYDVECSLVGFIPSRQNNVQISSGIFVVDFKMVENGKLLDAVIIKEYKVPIVKVDQTQQGEVFTSEQIKNLPLKNINAIVGMAAGVTTSSDKGEVFVKGSRSSATVYYEDGFLVRGSTVPVSDIEQLQIITGGLDAKYGDVTGGVINIITKGPASKLTGGVELETSKPFDKYNYNFLNVNLAGPIWQKDVRPSIAGIQNSKEKETIIGFRLSAQYRGADDLSPPAVPVYKVKPDIQKQLEANPVSLIGSGTPVSSAELLQTDAFDKLSIKPNQKAARYDITGKIDARLSKNLDISLGAKLYHNENQIDGGGTYPWEVFNSDYNPTQYRTSYRGNFKLRHRLTGLAGDKPTGALIDNAQYTIILGYEQNSFNVSDAIHKDNFFDYGYVGKFNYGWSPVYGTDATGVHQLGYLQRLLSYTRAEVNPILANYNNGIDANAAATNLNVFNGIFNHDNLPKVYTFHQNVGSVYNNYVKQQTNTLTGKFDLSFDIVPKGDRTKAHNIEAGFIYEQRNDRSYRINPFSLWDLAERLQNQNINGFGADTTKPLRDTVIQGQKVKIYAPLKTAGIDALTDNRFWKNYRAKFGLAETSFGNVNNLTPDQMSLDLFTARELNDQNLIGYYGYDYLGKPLGTNVTFNDFFTSKDANGTRTFPVAALQPIYFGGYIQDKFRIGDLIISAGLRVDRYDANTKVLKDPYSLYDIMSAKDYYALIKQPKPDNIGDDYKVYITSNTFGKTAYNYKANDIQAYRVGDQWYTKTGQPSAPELIFNGTQTFAKYKVDTFATVKQLGYDPSISFTDYQAQFNFMPRLAFSFPISDVANFFAHYDVLVSRPTSNNTVTALQYYYFDDVNRTPENNANLKPETTVDYEVGFQQKVNDNSGIKVAAYYKDLKNMIQLRYYKYLPAPLNITQYTSYSNLDFGTVKGFTFQYDLRPLNHFSGQFNYTLQFADGTGSDPQSQRDINLKGNIRVLSPLNNDERHRFAFTMDYRYDNSKYDGPILFGMEIFKRAGINLQTMMVSGRPYTAYASPNPFGASQIAGDINGSRLPWTFNVDLRIDKTIPLSKNPKKPLDLNVYLRVQNLLNTLNVADVYRASGSASDDGYLTSARGQSELANTLASRGQLGLQAYMNSYIMRELNPGFYFLPRQIYLGCNFGF